MIRKIHFWLGMFVLHAVTASGAVKWHSDATGRDVPLEWLEPSITAIDRRAPVPLVFYLTHLGATRVGTEADEAIVADFRTQGYLVAVLDYANDPHARMPALARDLVALRKQLQHKSLSTGRVVDLAHVFVVPSGCRLKRDVIYYREADHTFAMDIVYPSKPAKPVGAILEFSCDNANRMSNASIDFCTDTVLPGAAIAGFAAAMADHPVPAPYGGLDPMPDCARKIKAAIRTLRSEGSALPLNGRIIPAGFSRGSGMALMALTTVGVNAFEGHGEHTDTGSSVQGAVVMSGRFTYIDLLPGDKMISRYERAWGPRASQLESWRAHGALDYLKQPPSAPLFLTINVSESPDALHQMDVLRHRLTELGGTFTYAPESEPRGHKMPLDPDVLENLFHYLDEQLRVAPELNPPSSLHP